MDRIRCLSVVATLTLLWILPGQAMGQLGQTDFPNSGNTEAQEPFLEGLLLLHSFEYEDARTAFRKAQEADPSFAMAYWGEAMTHNKPLWLREELAAARETLERLAPTPEERLAKAPTEREKAYLRAVEALFGEGEKLDRDHRYADAMRTVMTAFPDDLDAASFYALALLGTCHDGRDAVVYMRAAAVVEEVFAKNPEHPGAAHYLIHSYDDPVHAPLGLRAARVYAGIAPDAVHALHMPSHIFLAMGMWDETVASNIASFVASERRRDRLGQERYEHDYHSLSWLHYALLQQGRHREAKAKLDIFLADAADFPVESTHSAAAGMWATHVVETGRLDLPPPEVNLEHLSADRLATFFFAQGWTALGRGEVAAASRALEELREHLDGGASSENEQHCATSYAPTTTTNAQILQAELTALIALAKGENETALAQLETATALEEGLPFGSGPADPLEPSFELYGEVLLQLDRPGEAREQFEAALARSPRRAHALAGLAEAARRLGDDQLAEATQQALAEVRQQADPGAEVPSLLSWVSGDAKSEQRVAATSDAPSGE